MTCSFVVSATCFRINSLSHWKPVVWIKFSCKIEYGIDISQLYDKLNAKLHEELERQYCETCIVLQQFRVSY